MTTDRRLWITGAAAAAAGLAWASGVGDRWLRPAGSARADRAGTPDPFHPTHPAEASGASGPPDPTDIWPLRFPTPGGSELALSRFKGQPLLVNFWATWCPPCVAELPLLDRFQRQQPATGWRVVGLAVDQLAPVVRFLAQRPVSYPVALAGAEGVALSRRLGNAGGGLPFSLVFDRSGEPLGQRLGIVSTVDLAAWSDAAQRR